jgi:hypothetical protein
MAETRFIWIPGRRPVIVPIRTPAKIAIRMKASSSTIKKDINLGF